MLFPTTLVGSYPQPEWLIDRRKLAGRFPPRVRARELWRVSEPWLEEAQHDATLLAIRAQEDVGPRRHLRGPAARRPPVPGLALRLDPGPDFSADFWDVWALSGTRPRPSPQAPL